MCVAYIAFKQREDFPLIIATNRDEFYSRKAAPLRYWPTEKLFAGKDLQAGGTWFGLGASGFFALLTNYRDLSLEQDRESSRGHLVLDVLQQPTIEAAVELLTKTASNYNPFNLLIGNKNELWHFNNQENSLTECDAGIYGLSNASLNTPWPKVKHGKLAFVNAVADDELQSQELFQLLSNETIYTEDLPSTGLSQELEEKLSAIFIKTEKYGTVNSSVLIQNKAGLFHFMEKNHLLSTISSFSF